MYKTGTIYNGQPVELTEFLLPKTQSSITEKVKIFARNLLNELDEPLF